MLTHFNLQSQVWEEKETVLEIPAGQDNAQATEEDSEEAESE